MLQAAQEQMDSKGFQTSVAGSQDAVDSPASDAPERRSGRPKRRSPRPKVEKSARAPAQRREKKQADAAVIQRLKNSSEPGSAAGGIRGRPELEISSAEPIPTEPRADALSESDKDDPETESQFSSSYRLPQKKIKTTKNVSAEPVQSKTKTITTN